MVGNSEQSDFPAPPEDFLGYSANKVVSILDDPQSVQDAIDKLVQAGFETEDISVLCGPRGAARLDVSGRDHGLRGRLYRFVEQLGSEHEWLETHSELMASGGFGVSVSADEGEKGRAAKILGEHGGHDTAYFGETVWQSM